MSWEDFVGTTSNLFSILESIAVIGTLIYLVKQVRDNTTAVKGASYQSAINAFADFEARTSQDLKTARIYQLAREKPDKLTNDEKTRAIQLMSTYFNLYENLYYHYKNGLLEKDLWAGWCRGLMNDLHNKPGVKHWWERTKNYYSKDFSEYVDLGKCPE